MYSYGGEQEKREVPHPIKKRWDALLEEMRYLGSKEEKNLFWLVEMGCVGKDNEEIQHSPKIIWCYDGQYHRRKEVCSIGVSS